MSLKKKKKLTISTHYPLVVKFIVSKHYFDRTSGPLILTDRNKTDRVWCWPIELRGHDETKKLMRMNYGRNCEEHVFSLSPPIHFKCLVFEVQMIKFFVLFLFLGLVIRTQRDHMSTNFIIIHLN